MASDKLPNHFKTEFCLLDASAKLLDLLVDRIVHAVWLFRALWRSAQFH